MPQTIKKGPLSAEDAAAIYAAALHNRLRHGRTWRTKIAMLLKEEYVCLAGTAATGGTLGVQTIWEYYWLVHATNQYLRTCPDAALAAWCYERAAHDLAHFNQEIARIRFDDREKHSIGEVIKNMLSLMNRWKELTDEARG